MEADDDPHKVFQNWTPWKNQPAREYHTLKIKLDHSLF